MQGDELQLKLSDLKQALAIEEKHHYCNVQGRKQTFSSFMMKTLKTLSGPTSPVKDHFSTFLPRFQRYEWMDLNARITAIQGISRMLSETLTAFEKSKQSLQKSRSANWKPQAAPLPVAGNLAALPAGIEAETMPVKPANQMSVANNAFKENPLDTIPVEALKGVGPAVATKLKSVGIQTIEDLLYTFPRRYIDYQQRVKIKELEEGQDVTVIAQIVSVATHETKTGLTILRIKIHDGSGYAVLQWFLGKRNLHQILTQYQTRYPKNAEVMVSGRVKWDWYQKCPSFEQPSVDVLSYADAETNAEPENIHTGRIVPVYPLTEGLHLKTLRRLIHQTLQIAKPQLTDVLPESIRSRYQLCPLSQALQEIHFPSSLSEAEEARRRLVFDELFYLQARLAFIRAEYQTVLEEHREHFPHLTRRANGLVDKFLACLPFQLTGAQQRVFQEVCEDLVRPAPMYRLLHGDVGSGKTLVALLTLLMAVEHGYQGCLMAPTEILAEQHYQKLVAWLMPLGIKVGLFLGKHGRRERSKQLQDLASGQTHIAIGTHALIQEEVTFTRLGVIVVDEQHRFGVRQRMLLKEKGHCPHMLTMTATPIPRTLALTVHGDLDVSTLDELPPGRSPITTVYLPASKAKEAYQLIRQQIISGHQAYIVLPLIEESETLSAKAATTEYARLKTEVFPEYAIGLLHGKLRSEEKESVMHAFVTGQLHVLVATTVVEVGVDVPNATIMMIEDADRFGLAQLHQLRGRVGRGVARSTCILISKGATLETKKRLEIMTQTQNGFEIAERDLALRGPGEFLGTKQSGLPDFLLSDLTRDKAVLENARQAAFELLSMPDIETQYPALIKSIQKKTEWSFSVLGSG